MRANYFKNLITLIALALFLSHCGNCDDGVNYEDQTQNRQVSDTTAIAK